MADLSEFLNPRSMVTPGVAGGTTMLITNTVSVQFGAPANWTGLAVSFLLGALLVLPRSEGLWSRAGFFAINSLIIFSVALGTNGAGQAVTRPVAGAPTASSPIPVPTRVEALEEQERLLQEVRTRVAETAQRLASAETAPAVARDEEEQRLREQLARLSERQQTVRDQLEQHRTTVLERRAIASKKFFQPWLKRTQ